MEHTGRYGYRRIRDELKDYRITQGMFVKDTVMRRISDKELY